MLNIVFLDCIGIFVIYDIFCLSFLYNWVEYDCISSDEIFECVKDVDIIVISKVLFGCELLVKLFKLKLIVIMVIGINNVDLVVVKEFGICVKNVIGYFFVIVLEYVLGMIFLFKYSLMSYYYD